MKNMILQRRKSDTEDRDADYATLRNLEAAFDEADVKDEAIPFEERAELLTDSDQ